MAYVVTEACIRCKYTECVEVCPQTAFREGVNFVVIDPKSCSHCALCQLMCPVDAIYPDYDLPQGQERYAELNRALAEEWPVAGYRMAPDDADTWAGRTDKADQLSMDAFSD